MSRTEGLTDFNALHKHLCLLWDYREKIKYKLNNLFLCLLNVLNGYYITQYCNGDTLQYKGLVVSRSSTPSWLTSDRSRLR